MPIADSATHQPPQQPTPDRLGLHDAFWTRAMLFWMRWLPKWLVIALTYPVTAVVCLLAVPQREAVRLNLAALLPPRRAGARAVFRVFLQFALTYLDRLWHLHFQQEVKWEIIGLEEFEKLRQEKGGALIFTVHSGNYDIGAALFARKFGRQIHTVRVPEATSSLQQLREQELREEERREPHLRIHYNEPGGHLGMELCRRLMAGEVVCVQGDRVIGDVAPTLSTIDGVTYRIPRGPLVLAEVTGVPCYPVFLTRNGMLNYRIELGRPFFEGGRKPKAAEISAAWLPVMHQFLRGHWDQWFVFEPLVIRERA
jgi:KDO2-lipid IV(A) lauroyltransferase